MTITTKELVALLRAAIEAGEYSAGDPMPSQRELAKLHGVSQAVPQKAYDELKRLDLVTSSPRSGMVASGLTRPGVTEWPLTGRYARARAAGGLVFGPQLDKQTVGTEWLVPDAEIAKLMGSRAKVLQRRSRSYFEGVPVELTEMHFPRSVVEAAPELETAESIRVVELIEGAGYGIALTDNAVGARLATQDETDLLRLEPSAVVFEHLHATRTEDGQAVEVVRNIKPAAGGTRLVFQTNERPL